MPRDGISLTGSPCKPISIPVVDSGPVAYFETAARNANSAMVRVLVEQQEFFAVGQFNLDDWIGFSIDGGPAVALPAKGVEPVVVTALFPGLPRGPHRVTYTVYQQSDVDGVAQGVVCL
jgi:hypothetical protein